MFNIIETFKKDSPDLTLLITNYIKRVMDNEQNNGVILFFMVQYNWL